MSKQTSYDALLNQFNRVTAQYKDLEEQKRECARNWGETERKYKHTISLAKDLCKMILAKEHSSDFLGKDYSLDAFPTDELILRAKEVFVTYNNERTKMESGLQQKLVETQATLDNLKTQYAYLQTHMQDAVKKTREDSEAIIEETVRADETPIQARMREFKDGKATTPKPVNYTARKAVESGAVEVSVISEDEDISMDDLRQQGEMAEINTELRLAEGKPIVRASKVVQETMQKVTDNTAITAIGGTVQVDVEDLCKKLSERRKIILKIIGETGLFLSTEIFEKLQETGEIKSASFKNDIFSLKTSGLLKVSSISIPVLCQHGNVYELTPAGAATFKRIFGKDACPSGTGQIIKDHDNLEHGLGIVAMKNILEKFKSFIKITTDRKDNTIVLDTGDKYIPDAICKSNKFTAYFEYELSTHKQADFNIKLNKMCKKTRYINIVTNSIPNCDSLSKKVIAWVQSRGGFGCLPGYIVRITTLNKLNLTAEAGKSFQDKDCWNYYYDLGASEPEHSEA